MSTADAPAELLADPTLVVDQATAPRDRWRIGREIAGRAWAVRHGIPTAEVVAADPQARWLVSRRVVDEPHETERFVEAALDASLRVQAAPDPGFADGANAWRAPRWTAPFRVARMVRVGIDPRAFVAARQAVAEQPRTATVHNDFHRGNVLHRSATDVAIIDWELLATGPRHLDMVQLIVDLTDPARARSAWDLLLSVVDPAERVAVAEQLRWIAVRTYASDLSDAKGEHDPEKLARRRARWHDARRWAAEWGVS